MTYEEWACPLAEHVVEHDEDIAGGYIGHDEPCGATLHLVWSITMPVPTPDKQRIWSRGALARSANTDGWEVVCENGHTLATHSLSAEDYVEPFDAVAVMAACGAKLVERDL